MFGQTQVVSIVAHIEANGVILTPGKKNIVAVEEGLYAINRALQKDSIVLISGGEGVGKSSLIEGLVNEVKETSQVIRLNPSFFQLDGQLAVNDPSDEKKIFVVNIDGVPKEAIDFLFPAILKEFPNSKIIAIKTVEGIAPQLTQHLKGGLFENDIIPLALKDCSRIHVNESSDDRTFRILDSMRGNMKFVITNDMIKAIIRLSSVYFPKINNPLRSVKMFNALDSLKLNHINYCHNEAMKVTAQQNKVTQIHSAESNELIGNSELASKLNIDLNKVNVDAQSMEELVNNEIPVAKEFISSSTDNAELLEQFAKYNHGVFDVDKVVSRKNIEQFVVATSSHKLYNVAVTVDDVVEALVAMTALSTQRVKDEVESTLSKIKNIAAPINKITDLSDKLNKTVIGQEQAIDAIVKSIAINSAGLGNTSKPIGSFMFLGTTGVGKTHLAKQLAKNLLGDEERMVRFDMSEYAQSNSSEKLIGAPAGYVGYDAGGILTNLVAKNPETIILLDEIEKANPQVFDLFLQVLDDGRLTDNKGTSVDFSKCVIIMTSNIGSQHIIAGKGDEAVLQELQGKFRPEFLNRLDAKIVFNPLGEKSIRIIMDSIIKKFQKTLLDRKGIVARFADSIKDRLMEDGYDKHNGARPMERAFNNLVIHPVSIALLENQDAKTLIVKNNEIQIVTEE